MRLISRVLASGIVLAVASIGAHAQGLCGARTPSGPIQYVSDAEFDQMVGGGTLLMGWSAAFTEPTGRL